VGGGVNVCVGRLKVETKSLSDQLWTVVDHLWRISTRTAVVSTRSAEVRARSAVLSKRSAVGGGTYCETEEGAWNSLRRILREQPGGAVTLLELESLAESDRGTSRA